ncbi:MAG: TrkH family potassium uptake protein [Clostridiales bacterium]
MNYSIITYIIGWIFAFNALFLSIPCIVSIIYNEQSGFYFLFIAILCLLIGAILISRKPKSKVFYIREGFVTVSLSWIIISTFGALPFVLSGEIPSFIDAMFETISGFTTTGSSILTDIESLSHTALFWRSFTHWIGGMGVLVLILAILPLAGGYNMNLMRAESPGPSVSKLVPKIRNTAMILYGIYCFLTVTEVIFLLFGGMSLFDSLTHAFATAGTGGFSTKNTSFTDFSPYLQVIATIFMILFGLNFNVYFLFLIKKPIKALKFEEMRYYLGIITIVIIIITINISHMFSSLSDAIRHAAFQVAAIITTTGFSSIDFDKWPQLSKTLLLLLMLIGACAGSTGGGVKVSRIIILLKTLKKELYSYLHPRSIKKIQFEKKCVEHEVLRNINVFIMAYSAIFGLSLLLISFDNFDFTTHFTAIVTTINNIGPGFELIGPTNNFSIFSSFSKIVLMFDMLAGRLELFPILFLFLPATWKKHT